jgi:ribosomal protein L12E/L44/L45/RPP1/RPP2
VHVFRETARAITAVLNLATIAIEDAVAKVCAVALRGFYLEELVEADAEMAVGELSDLLRTQCAGLRHCSR